MSKLTKALRRAQNGYCAAVVVAAGQSRRMGEDKLFLTVGGCPVLALTLSALERSPDVQEIVLVTTPERVDDVEKLRLGYRLTKLRRVVFGGETRTVSARNGVLAVSERANIICIHDAARPFVTEAVIAGAVRGAELYLAAAPAVPVKDTVKLARDGAVESTPERERLFAVQTPQAFRAELIKAALTAAVEAGVSYSDDCAAVEAIGATVHLTEGDEENIKLTTPFDLALAEAIWRRRQEAEA